MLPFLLRAVRRYLLRYSKVTKRWDRSYKSSMYVYSNAVSYVLDKMLVSFMLCTPHDR